MTLIELYEAKKQMPDHEHWTAENVEKMDELFGQKGARDSVLVYLFYNNRTGFTKVGKSYQPNVRIKTLEMQCGCPLLWLFSIELDKCRGIDSSQCEEFVQDYFEDKCEVGEWYRLSPHDWLHIKEFFDYLVYEDWRRELHVNASLKQHRITLNECNN